MMCECVCDSPCTVKKGICPLFAVFILRPPVDGQNYGLQPLFQIARISHEIL